MDKLDNVMSQFMTNEEQARKFDLAIADAIERMSGQKVGVPQQVMVGVLTESSDVMVMTGAEPEKAIFMALVALKQVYDTQVDNERKTLVSFAEDMKKYLISLEDQVKASTEIEFHVKPN